MSATKQPGIEQAEIAETGLVRDGIASRLRALTPARVGLAATGVSLETREVLDFALSHARARDAVHARLDAAARAASLGALTSVPVLRLHSAARDRAEYLQRPDLGRRLNDASRKLLAEQLAEGTDVALIVADGLSALAVERHAAPLLAELLPRIADWSLAPICIVEQGRVAVGDEIGKTLQAQIAVVLIGERPGLSSPDSLGAYVTWQPRPGLTDAERVCISNIRPEGLAYTPAAAQLARVIAEARRSRLTGVAPRAIAASTEAEKPSERAGEP
jgi:ethanolamine ammonia-lyase small subunit